MKAVVVSGPGQVAVENIPDPTPGRGDLILAVRGSGLCGTDLHLIDGELPYDSFPVVPGHEFFGEVVEVGEDIDRSRRGALVAVDPNLPCRRCEECRRGRANLCLNFAGIGVTVDGGCAEYVRVPADRAYDLVPGTPAAAAQLIEPLSCAVHGFDRLPREATDRYLIYGAGTMGLLMALIASEVSGGAVSIVEPSPTRRAFAAARGLRAAGSADEWEGQRWDIVIDCTGVPAAIEDGLSRVRRGGTFQCFGVAAQDAVVSLRPFSVYRDELTIVGTMAVHNSFGAAVQLAPAWADRLAPLVTDHFGLDDYATAVAAFRAGRGLKIVIA